MNGHLSRASVLQLKSMRAALEDELRNAPLRKRPQLHRMIVEINRELDRKERIH